MMSAIFLIFRFRLDVFVVLSGYCYQVNENSLYSGALSQSFVSQLLFKVIDAVSPL